MRNEFNEKLKRLLVRGRDNRIRPFDFFSVSFDSQRGVLAGKEFEWGVRLEAQEPQVRGKIAAFDDSRTKMLVCWKGNGVSELLFLPI